MDDAAFDVHGNELKIVESHVEEAKAGSSCYKRDRHGRDRRLESRSRSHEILAVPAPPRCSGGGLYADLARVAQMRSRETMRFDHGWKERLFALRRSLLGLRDREA